MHITRAKRLVSLFASLAFTCSAAIAAKPDGEGIGQGKKHKHREERHEEVKIGGYFGVQHRETAHEYHGKQRAAGRCPPGPAKKNNGCMPPGQAKKWARGKPVPNTVVTYAVPRSVIIKIGIPPPGYKYIRAANDILLIAIGTQMVVDAIEDLMR